MIFRLAEWISQENLKSPNPPLRRYWTNFYQSKRSFLWLAREKESTSLIKTFSKTTDTKLLILYLTSVNLGWEFIMPLDTTLLDIDRAPYRSSLPLKISIRICIRTSARRITTRNGTIPMRAHRWSIAPIRNLKSLPSERLSIPNESLSSTWWLKTTGTRLTILKRRSTASPSTATRRKKSPINSAILATARCQNDFKKCEWNSATRREYKCFFKNFYNSGIIFLSHLVII